MKPIDKPQKGGTSNPLITPSTTSTGTSQNGSNAGDGKGSSNNPNEEHIEGLGDKAGSGLQSPEESSTKDGDADLNRGG
jgi:hypothetical protein